MSTLPSFVAQGVLPLTTVLPQDKALYEPYFIRLYEQISLAVNQKDSIFFQIPVTSTPTNIPNVANFGSFLVNVSGSAIQTDGSYLPTISTALCKSSAAVAGAIATLTSQVGTGTWAAVNLSITSTATNYQIAHTGAATLVGNFNIRVVGTQ